MRHLFSYSVYHEAGDDPGTVDDILGTVDGLELLTSYSEPPSVYMGKAVGVHLPHAVDLMGGWNGSADTSEMSDDDVKYAFYGRDRDDVIKNVIKGIRNASILRPEYGVFHAGSVNMDDVFTGKMRYSDNEVIDASAELMNSVVSEFDGRPPFKILFENLWWPGLRMIDRDGFNRLRDRLEFDDWGLCIDTGHLMIAAGTFREEDEAVDTLTKIFETYTDEMIERIVTMHLHSSTAPKATVPVLSGKESQKDRMRLAYGYVSKLDPHHVFDGPRCVDLVNMLAPDHVTHELVSPQERRISDLIRQRSFFG